MASRVLLSFRYAEILGHTKESLETPSAVNISLSVSNISKCVKFNRIRLRLLLIRVGFFLENMV